MTVVDPPSQLSEETRKRLEAIALASVSNLMVTLTKQIEVLLVNCTDDIAAMNAAARNKIIDEIEDHGQE